MRLSEEQRASALNAVREAGEKLRTVPRAYLEALWRESPGHDAEVARLALCLADAEYARQLDAMRRIEGGPCPPSMLQDRTHAQGAEVDLS
ncbi:MAG: hypothetical protein NTX87_00360 [Planctomycetota bacterium]|nr:hypothetical protein [Planctomycetota bacterium]